MAAVYQSLMLNYYLLINDMYFKNALSQSLWIEASVKRLNSK